MVPDLRLRRQNARDREVAWMAAAIINARYSAERFAPLLSLVGTGPMPSFARWRIGLRRPLEFARTAKLGLPPLNEFSAAKPR